VLGAAACVATGAPIENPHSPFLLNASPTTATVTITWVMDYVPCYVPAGADEAVMGPGATPASLAASLTPSDLDHPRTLALDRGQVSALDGPPPAGVSPVGTCTTYPTGTVSNCVAAILQSPPAAPALMVAPASWFESDTSGVLSCDSPPPPVSLCQASLDPDRDPGPDAVTLKEVNGTLTFVAGSKVLLGPVDPAAIAARPPSPTGCRTIADPYHALIVSPPACSTNADCVASIGLQIPGDPSTCGVYLPISSWPTFEGWVNAWAVSCPSATTTCSSALQPAVCRDGACGPACPGEALQTCPNNRCPSTIFQGGSCNVGALGCQSTDTTACTCVKGAWSCGPSAPLSASCPLTCSIEGGGTLVDGGVIHPMLPDGAALNAGALDAAASD
jgi:hypothetical protein